MNLLCYDPVTLGVEKAVEAVRARFLAENEGKQLKIKLPEDIGVSIKPVCFCRWLATNQLEILVFMPR